MFGIITFVLCMAPVLLIFRCGVKSLVQSVGKKATIALISSLPFYFIIIKALFEEVSHSLQNMASHVENSRILEFSIIEWISCGCFVILLIAFQFFYRLHKKEHFIEENRDSEADEKYK